MIHKKTFTQEELSEILRKHKNWLLLREDGERANLEDAEIYQCYFINHQNREEE